MLPNTVSRVCVDQRSGVRYSRASSNSTGKPMLPAITPRVSGRQIHGSLTKPIRLSLKSAKPALLNACTAWKTPYQTALPNG